MRPRSSFMSSGSHFSLFHSLRDLIPKLLGSESSSWYLSSVLLSSSRTSQHPSAMSRNSLSCRPLSFRSDRKSSTSRRALERPLTLENQNKLQYSSYWIDSLMRNCPELVRSINKLFPDRACKFGYSNNVANRKAKTHRDLQRHYYCRIRRKLFLDSKLSLWSSEDIWWAWKVSTWHDRLSWHAIVLTESRSHIDSNESIKQGLKAWDTPRGRQH